MERKRTRNGEMANAFKAFDEINSYTFEKISTSGLTPFFKRWSNLKLSRIQAIHSESRAQKGGSSLKAAVAKEIKRNALQNKGSWIQCEIRTQLLVPDGKASWLYKERSGALSNGKAKQKVLGDSPSDDGIGNQGNCSKALG
jgi:hypothetical protein